MRTDLFISAGSCIGGREENQDNLIVDTILKEVGRLNADFCTDGKLSMVDEKLYFLVCDGMGGMQDGSEASTMAVRYFYDKIPLLRGRCSCLDIYKFVLDLNIKMADYFEDKQLNGGSTFSLLQINPDQTFEIFNIGDSPVWLLRKNKLTMLSEEQNLAGMMLKNHRITEEEYENSPKKSTLLYNLGDGSMKSVLNLYYTGKISLQYGDVILMASDGLAGSLGRKKLLRMLNDGSDASELLAEAKKDPRADNITVIKIAVK